MGPHTLLANFLPVLIQGEDARSFMQGLLTCDLRKLTPTKAAFGAHNTPDGHVRMLMTLVERKEGILALFEPSLAEIVLASLRMRILRSKVSIEPVSFAVAPVTEPQAHELVGTLPQAPGECVGEDEVTVLRWWGNRPRFLVLAPVERVRVTPDGGDRLALEWRRSDIQNGIPRVSQEIQGKFIAQMLNLDVLNAVSYDKGCYIGQEAVGRARSRGVTRRMFRFVAPFDAPLPGTTIMSENVAVGSVVDAVTSGSGCELLAVVDLAALPKPLHLEGQSAHLELAALPHDVPQ